MATLLILVAVAFVGAGEDWSVRDWASPGGAVRQTHRSWGAPSSAPFPFRPGIVSLPSAPKFQEVPKAEVPKPTEKIEVPASPQVKAPVPPEQAEVLAPPKMEVEVRVNDQSLGDQLRKTLPLTGATAPVSTPPSRASRPLTGLPTVPLVPSPKPPQWRLVDRWGVTWESPDYAGLRAHVARVNAQGLQLRYRAVPAIPGSPLCPPGNL